MLYYDVIHVQQSKQISHSFCIDVNSLYFAF